MFKFESVMAHDAFRYQGLGRTAGVVWLELQECPLSVDDLVNKTGRHNSTILRALQRMSKIVDTTTGERIKMAEELDGKWYPIEVNLDQIAGIIGTAGIAKRQHQKHIYERKIHRRSLQIGNTKQYLSVYWQALPTGGSFDHHGAGKETSIRESIYDGSTKYNSDSIVGRRSSSRNDSDYE